jgi:hypothetical protein
MLNPLKEVNWNPGIVERRKFAMSIAIGLPFVALALGWLGWLRSDSWSPWTSWLAGCGGGLGLVLRLAPRFAKPFYVIWYGLGCCVGLIVGNIAIAAIFYLVITPAGLLLRIFGRDPMERRFEPGRKTYWNDAEKVEEVERYFRQY